MAFGTTALAVIPALVAAWTAQLPNTTIRDTNIISGSGELEAITVGWNPDATQPAISGVFSADNTQFVGSPLEERYTIHNAISVLNGNSDMVAARNRSLVILNSVGAGLLVDPTIGGVVLRASLGAWELMPYQQISGGAIATLGFGVDIYAFTTV